MLYAGSLVNSLNSHHTYTLAFLSRRSRRTRQFVHIIMDSDILAVLFPLEPNAARAFRLPENAPFHHEPSTPM